MTCKEGYDRSQETSIVTTVEKKEDRNKIEIYQRFWTKSQKEDNMKKKKKKIMKEAAVSGFKYSIRVK